MGNIKGLLPSCDKTTGSFQTMVGKEAEMTKEELPMSQLPGRISCKALAEYEEDGNRVDTSVSITKKG